MARQQEDTQRHARLKRDILDKLNLQQEDGNEVVVPKLENEHEETVPDGDHMTAEIGLHQKEDKIH